MACCTTISPLNTSQKRRTSGMYDFPHTAKRRRPLSSNNLSNSTSTMFTTTTSLLNSNKPVIIESSDDKKQSPFQAIPYSPMYGMASECPDSNENQYKNELMERIRHEAKRLIRRRQMGVSSVNMVGTNVDNSSPESSLTSEPLSPSDSNNNAECKISKLKTSLLSHNDVPLFSMNQVNSICDKMLKEREQIIREQYDKILAQKLNEQYDAFVKFTHEQIQRRFETSQCTYVS